MLFSNLLIDYISGTILLMGVIVLLVFLFLLRKKIFLELKKIPLSLFLINFCFFLYGLFFVPKTFSGRGDFGVWLTSTQNTKNWQEIIANIRCPVYLWRNKLFSEILGGISYEFIVALNFIGFFLSVFLLYLLIRNLTKNEKSAYAGSFFYLISPVVFAFSMTEDYALPALFFSILSLFFASLQIKTKNYLFFFPAIASALLSAGSRIEYIIFPYFLIFFYLLFLKKEWKKIYCYLLFFFLLLLPRTISVLGMYFSGAQFDEALHTKTYEYEGNFFSYIYNVITGASSFLEKNITEAVSIITNFRDLTGFFFFLGIISFIILIRKKNFFYRKIAIFFGFHFLFLFFFYNYFHTVGGIGGYRYLITVITPLIILSGIGFGFLLKNKSFLFYFCLQIIFCFVFLTALFPLTFQKHADLFFDNRLKYLITLGRQTAKKEYKEYKKLSYENNISRFLQDKESFDISRGEKTYFIINGTRTFLHVMPIAGNFICVEKNSDIEKILPLISKKDKVYASQSGIGFTSEQIIDNYKIIDPIVFEEKIFKFFKLEKELVSYKEDKHHIFLYKIEKK